MYNVSPATRGRSAAGHSPGVLRRAAGAVGAAEGVIEVFRAHPPRRGGRSSEASSYRAFKIELARPEEARLCTRLRTLGSHLGMRRPAHLMVKFVIW